MIYFNLLLVISVLILFEIFIFLSWPRLAKIYHSNYTFFDLFFISLYPLEEILFLILYNLKPSLRELWVSSIVVIICLTLVVDKYLLKKQNDYAILIHDNFLKDAIFKKDVRIKDYQEKLKLRDYEKSKLVDYVNSYKGKVKRLIGAGGAIIFVNDRKEEVES